MKKSLFLLVLVALFAASCQKKNQSDLLPHQTLNFNAGSDFEIKMPGALPERIKMIALSGFLQPVYTGDKVCLLLKAKGSEEYDTISINQNFQIDELNPDYFRYSAENNVLSGKILVNNMVLKNLVFEGRLSVIYHN